MSTLQLVLQIGQDRKRTVIVPLVDRTVVGRVVEGEAEQPQVDLGVYGGLEQGVSRLHAAILYQHKEIFVEDLHSTNGTRINGLPLQPNTPYRLRNGDELEFGSLCLSVRLMTKPV